MSSNGDEGTRLLTQSPTLRVPFLELNMVASSSFTSSPSLEVVNAPQVQLNRLREELAHEGDVRDKLERKLSECKSTISEKDCQISQLQHKLQRVLRDQEALEKDQRSAVLELQLKNEGLLVRVHEVVKQCQDLKADNSQKDRRIDELVEDNGKLAAQVRNASTQLARSKEEVSKLTVAHKLSQEEWGSGRDSLQKELSQAITDRECLSEQTQILQGKISVLEDELSRMSVQLQEKGEVLGSVLERENLKQELADLTLKLSQHEETISCLQKEKTDVETMLSEDRSTFKGKISRLQGLITDLLESVNSIQAKKEAQEQSARENQELLTAQIAALESRLARLQQLEVQLEAKVAFLEDTINVLQIKYQAMEVESEARQEALKVLRVNLQKAQASLVEYEGKLVDHHRVVEENSNLCARIFALDEKMVSLASEACQAKGVLEKTMTELYAKQEQDQQELETLQKEKKELISVSNSLKSECQNLQAEIRGREEALTLLKADMQNSQNVYQRDLQTLENEKECLLSVKQSLLSDCQSLHTENQEQKEALHSLQADLQNMRQRHHKDLETFMKEKDQLSSVNQSLQNECQSLQVEIKGQLEELSQLKANLQNTQDGCQQELEALRKEKDHLSTANQYLQGECHTLQAEIKGLQNTQDGYLKDLKTLQNEKEQISSVNKSLQSECQNLQAESKGQQEALNILKVDVQRSLEQHKKEKQVFQKEKEHLSSVNQSLQRECDAVRVSLKTAVSEMKALKSELKLASMELEKTRVSEKNLLVKTQSLEAQLDYADCQLREQRKQAGQGTRVKHGESVCREVPTEVQNTSTDSLEIDLDDSLNVTSKASIPGDTSTPLVRNSKRLVAKRCAQDRDSLEASHNRTSQSQPNLASQKTHLNSTVTCEETGTANSSDKLLSLPGYRKRNAGAPNTFCMGAEYEPDHVADDWIRIAELQSRNKACLPHLKSSYPLESRPSVRFSTHPLTDEDVCFGDPKETIRHASVVQSRQKDSSNRGSLAPPPASRDHTHTSQQIPRASSKAPEVRSVRNLLTRKRPACPLQDQDTPETKKSANCVLRQAASKSRRLCVAASDSENRPLSPAVRKQSMAFVIENTPKKSGQVDSRLKRGANKRKSPVATARPGHSNATATFRSPLQPNRQINKDPHHH